jgi:NMD protein affecting ribosome stability and mRNA decay
MDDQVCWMNGRLNKKILSTIGTYLTYIIVRKSCPECGSHADGAFKRILQVHFYNENDRTTW